MAELNLAARAFLRIRYVLDHRHGALFDPLMRAKWLGEMVRHGYAVVVIDRPGTSASFGTFTADMAVVAREEEEILNWIAAQSWSVGT